MFSTVLLTALQPDAPTGGAASAGTPPTGPTAGAPPGCGSAQSIGLMVVMFVAFYFLLIRPQQKRQKEQAAVLKALRKGDMVRTTGGILGEIVEATDRDVVLLIADKVKINVLRSALAGKEAPPAAAGSSEAKS